MLQVGYIKVVISCHDLLTEQKKSPSSTDERLFKKRQRHTLPDFTLVPSAL